MIRTCSIGSWLRTQDEVAAIINEPIGCNTGVIDPEPGFARHVRDAATAEGALLIYDEVITGFRVAPGGAQERLGIRPDLTVVAKAFGGGFSLAALGGRADIMALVIGGGVLHGGTFNANTTSIAAGLAVLRALDAAAYARIERSGLRLIDGLRAAAARHGVPLHVQGLPCVFNTAFGVDVDPLRRRLRARGRRAPGALPRGAAGAGRAPDRSRHLVRLDRPR